jgi:hypothetical protein
MRKSYPIISPSQLWKYSDVDCGSRSSIRAEIRDTWHRIQIRALGLGFRRVIPILPVSDSSINIFGSGTKTEKGETIPEPVKTLIWYGSPGRESGVELCDNRSPACTAGCLGRGCWHLKIRSGKNSKLWKTMLLVGNPDLFIRLLMLELDSHIRSCERNSIEPAARIDGSTDTGIGDVLSGFDRFSGCNFYDYSKSTSRLGRFLSGKLPDNRHLTYSRSEKNHRQSVDIVNRGGSVAVPVNLKRHEFPSTWCGLPVEDGDRHDVRYRDNPGTWQFLEWKGQASRKHAIASGFCVSVTGC